MKHYRPVARGGAGGLGGLVFGQTVNPISTRGADYAHHSPTSPPGFSDLATALLYLKHFINHNIVQSLLHKG